MNELDTSCSCKDHGTYAALECKYLGCSDKQTGIYNPDLTDHTDHTDNANETQTMEICHE